MVGFLRRFLAKRKPLSEQDRFSQQLIAMLQFEDPSIQVEYDPTAFELTLLDSQSRGHRVFLHNSFLESRRIDGPEKEAHLGRVARFVLESRKPAPIGEAALDNLLPVLRSRADIVAVAAGRERFPYSHSARPFCDNMLLMLAVDSDISISLVTDDILAELGVSFEQALGLAIAHLDERGNHSFGKLAEGTFVSTCEDYYDCSRLLIPGLLQSLPVKGSPVAIAQARSALLVTGSEDSDGLRMIADLVTADFPENERAISLSPINLRDGQWRSFNIEVCHPQSLKNLNARQKAWEYGATKDVLQSAVGDGIFVATSQLYENGGQLFSIASWAKGVPTACPLVDAIQIQGESDSTSLLRSMESVIDICGPFEPISQIEFPLRWLLPAEISKNHYERLKTEFPDFIPPGI